MGVEGKKQENVQFWPHWARTQRLITLHTLTVNHRDNDKPNIQEILTYITVASYTTTLQHALYTHIHGQKYTQSVYLHCTISSTTASRGFTLKPLYWLVWQRYEPVISLDTLTIRSTPSQLSICMLPSGMGASLSARDHRMMGLGFPETRHSSSTVSPSRATRGDLPRGTVRLGGTKKEKNRGGTDMGLQKVSRRGKGKWSIGGRSMGWGQANEHPSRNGNEAESQPHTQLVWEDHADIRSSNG